MPLQGPKKTPAGYFLALTPPVTTPEVRWSADAWELTEAWSTWGSAQREALLQELLAHPTWFSRPPRQDILSPIFGPWAGTNMAGKHVFMTDTPDLPGTGRSGKAIWLLEGILMSSTSITPVLKVQSAVAEVEEDRISLFGDGDTVAADSDSGSERGGETREIQLDEIEMGSPAGAAPTRIRNREWEARKFMGKERVREARLKAQIAARMADKEERRYFAQFGDLDDGESHFSDYDLTDDEASEATTDGEGSA
jgi:hypothetical protein